MRLPKTLILLLIVLFVVLQSTILNDLRILQNKPDIVLILLIFFSLYYGKIYGLWVGALLGIFSEATSAVSPGLLLLVYSLSGLILGHLAKIIDQQKTIGQISFCFFSCLLIYSLLFVLLRLGSINLSFTEGIIRIILPTAAYTAAVSPLLFSCLKIALEIKE